jgi:hypothetical protein
MALSFGANKSKMTSSSNSSMDQNVWGPQGNALGNMYGQAGNLYGNMMPYSNLGFNMMPQMQNQMTHAYQMGDRGAEGLLSGGSYGDTSGIRNNLYSSLQNSMANPSSTGRMYSDIVGGPGNTYIDPMVADMRASGNQNLQTQQNMTGLDAANLGQGGSSRHAMQNAMLGAATNRDMASLENTMRGGAYDTDLNWKMAIANQADTNRGAAQDRAMSALAGSDANTAAGMNYAPQMQNLSMGYMAPWSQAMQMPWMNMQNYQGIMGDPTVLSNATSSGSSQGKSSGFNFATQGYGGS